MDGSNMSYKISFDYTNYKNLDIDLGNAISIVGKNLGGSIHFRTHKSEGISLKAAWVDIGGSFVDVEGLPTYKTPDITLWNSSNLLLTQAAFSALSESLTTYGEFLSITIDGEDCQIFNCLNYVDVDESQSELDIDAEGHWLGIKRIAFSQQTENNNLIFRTKFDRGGTLYCGDAFKQRIETANLERLIFHTDLLDQF